MRGRKASSMRRANGTGCIRKLSGKRRKPWQVLITEKYEYDEATMKATQKQKTLGTYATREEAERALVMHRECGLDIADVKITFRDIYYIVIPGRKEKLKDSTLKAYATADKVLEKILDSPIRSYKTSELQHLIDTDGYASNINAKVRAMLIDIYDYAVKNDIVQKNYAEYITVNSETKRTVERKLYTKEDINALDLTNKYDQTIYILLHTGMRVMELLSPSTTIDTDKMTIDIKEAKNQSSIRTIPIPDILQDIIKSYKKVTYSSIRQYMYKAKDHTLHDTRHTFISKAQELGIRELYLKKLVGHTANDITSKVYTHIDLETLRKEINKIIY